MKFSQKINTENIDELLHALDEHKASGQIKESVIRKFVATHAHHYPAWFALLKIVAMNENWRELVRLAEQTAHRFPGDAAAPFWMATGLAHLLKIEQALACLAQASSEQQISAATAFLTAELQLAVNPAQALKTFSLLSQSHTDAARAQQGVASAKALLNSRAGCEVVCFQTSTWHVSIQQPVFDALTSQKIGCVMTSTIWLLQALQPQIIVLSDTPPSLIKWIRSVLPNTRIVNTRHGLGDKNYAYYASAMVDYVCASSEYVAQYQIESGCLNPHSVWATGFPQMDPLFPLCKKANSQPPGQKPHILFAPTFTRGLNAGELMGDHPVATLRGDQTHWHVTIRPHPHMVSTHPRLIEAWQRSVANSANATLDLNFQQSPAALLCRSDVMVSDVSSMALQFLALDRPMVSLVQADLAQASPYFASDSFEARLGDASLKINRVDELTQAIQTSLAGQQAQSIVSQRRALAQDLLGSFRDGLAGERIAAKILHLLDT